MDNEVEASYQELMSKLPLICKAIAAGANDYREISAEQRLKHSRLARSILIHDFIKDRVEKLDGTPGISLLWKFAQVRALAGNNHFQILFKKLDNNLRPSINNTRRSREYSVNNNDGFQLEFPNFPKPAMNLYAGYIWNAIGPIRTCVVSPYGDRFNLIFELVEENKSPIEETIIDQNTPEIRQVHPKQIMKKKPKENQTNN